MFCHQLYLAMSNNKTCKNFFLFFAVVVNSFKRVLKLQVAHNLDEFYCFLQYYFVFYCNPITFKYVSTLEKLALSSKGF